VRPALLLIFAGLATAVRAEDPLLESDVLPILTKNCMGCHGGLRKQGGLDLRTVPAMLAGGESGPTIVAGDVERSVLWKRIAADEMPAGDDREKLSAAEKARIRDWIAAGLPTVSQRQRNADTLLAGDERHEPREVAEAIDKHLDGFLASAKLAPVPLSDDIEFQRRVYLDLTGRVPTAKQASAFLDSTPADKRETLIESLLATPEFGQQFGRTWRDWICPPELPSTGNAGTQPHQQARAFGDWMGKKLAAGTGWDQITRDILTAQGAIKDSPQVIFFGVVGQDGKTNPGGTARAVASIFMGVQLKCAQCHDDPYRDWSQQQHWALAAFFGRSQGDFEKIEIGKGPAKQPGQIVIPGNAFKNAGTTVPAAFLHGETLQAKDVADLRTPLVDWLTAKDNPYFARAFANRLWFQLFARGIVNPIDDNRPLNPPSHPGLMRLLADEFAASGFDVKHLVRCLCRSQAYQRTSTPVPGTDAVRRAALTTVFGRMPLRVMTADMLHESLKLAYGEQELDLRSGAKVNTTGMAATVGDALLEFHRRFGTNEEDRTDFTHGVAQMLTLINHPRLLGDSKSLAEFLKNTPDASETRVIEWLYLSTLSRRPTAEEQREADAYLAQTPDTAQAYRGVLWMLVNRSEYLLVR
jgi:mono/diheme cytochrome c family protein